MSDPTKSNQAVGKPINRVDGRSKVTGAARFSAEFPIQNLAYGVLIMSTVAKGRVRRIDTEVAERAPGVFAVITHLNAPKLPFREPPKPAVTDPKAGRHLQVLQNNVVYFNGQPLGVVIADTLERATYAASLVKVAYDPEPHTTHLETAIEQAFPPSEAKTEGGRPSDTVRGNPQALAEAQVRVDQVYTIPMEHHNPMEPHATIAVWKGKQLTLYDKTQWVGNVRQRLALTFGIPEENVRVISPFVGGAFGSALRVWSHTIVAAIAAQQVNRPVKLVLTREQMFTSHGHRPYTRQRVVIGASPDGKLSAIVHEATAATSPYEEFTENTLSPTRLLYDTPNLITKYRLVRLNINTPTYMRGPGEVSGTFALESAMDELAYALKLDPIELRVRNEPVRDPEKNLPWSSRSLVECFRQGAQRFGWEWRNPEPRSMREGRFLVGMGVAAATYPTQRSPASAMARILADGTALVQSAASDIGPGTRTTMTLIAADALGIPIDRVRFELGDSKMPKAPVQGGSQITASVGSAVRAACMATRGKVLAMALNDRRSPLRGATEAQVAVENGRFYLKSDPSRSETYAEILRRQRLNQVEAMLESKPGEEAKQFSMHAFGAQFVEVRVDPELGQVRVTRVVSAVAAGRIMSAKTAHSQSIGGIVGGIGMALMEKTVMDHSFGRIVNGNLGEYHVPVNADVPVIESFFVEEVDTHVNPLGAKGIGEIAMVGVAPAIANAVYHATGKRILDLPITPDKLL